MTQILLTGCTGFLGSALEKQIASMSGLDLSVALRTPRNTPLPILQYVVGDLSEITDWSMALAGKDVVVHTAARVHVLNETEGDPFSVFRKVNVDSTLNLARQAAAAGVKRFVFVSSIKVNGERTQLDHPYKASDIPLPEDSYGISKAEAEIGLRQIASETGLEVVIIRPPLIYGPGVKGNFATMMHWLKRGIPLPLGLVQKNRRSLVALDNLVDLIVTCIRHPAAANKTFLINDGEDVSTTDLLVRLSRAMGRPPRLLPIPPILLRVSASFLGKNDMLERLLGNLQIDASYTCQTLSWRPPIGLDEGLRRVVHGASE